MQKVIYGNIHKANSAHREKDFFGFSIPIYLIKIYFIETIYACTKYLNKNFVVLFEKSLLLDRNNIII